MKTGLLLSFNFMQNKKSCSKCSSSNLFNHFIIFQLRLRIAIFSLHWFLQKLNDIKNSKPTSATDQICYISTNSRRKMTNSVQKIYQIYIPSRGVMTWDYRSSKIQWSDIWRDIKMTKATLIIMFFTPHKLREREREREREEHKQKQ